MPTVSMAMAAPPVNNPPQVMMGMPTQPQPQPTPMMGMPPMQPQPTPMMGMPMQPQPQQSFAAATAVGLILNNPNLIDRVLGALGRLLARRGQPRLTNNAISPATVALPQAGIPMMGQPATMMGVPQQPANPYQLYYVPPPSQNGVPAQPARPYQPTPSPQDYQPGPSPQSPEPGQYAPQPRRHFSLFHRQ